MKDMARSCVGSGLIISRGLTIGSWAVVGSGGREEYLVRYDCSGEREFPAHERDHVEYSVYIRSALFPGRLQCGDYFAKRPVPVGFSGFMEF